MESKEWYLEYDIEEDRPGLLGEITSLLGMLRINILSINGVGLRRRGMLLKCFNEEAIIRLRLILNTMDYISLLKLTQPKLSDRMAVLHGKYISHDEEEKKIFRFTRGELGILIDFLGELFKRDGHRLIGFRGMPRVGKTEAVVAASVYANKRWSLISSTLLLQTARSKLADDEMSPDHVYVIDGIVSTTHVSKQHKKLISEIIKLPATKVIEHPDIFIQKTEYSLEDFDYIIELRSCEDENISYEAIECGFDKFDISE